MTPREALTMLSEAVSMICFTFGSDQEKRLRELQDTNLGKPR